MKHEPVPSGKRHTITLSLADELIADAEELGIDPEQTFEEAVSRKIGRLRAYQEIDANPELIKQWNEWIEKNPLPLEKYRLF